jgi:hypothetical protein
VYDVGLADKRSLLYADWRVWLVGGSPEDERPVIAGEKVQCASDAGAGPRPLGHVDDGKMEGKGTAPTVVAVLPGNPQIRRIDGNGKVEEVGSHG